MDNKENISADTTTEITLGNVDEYFIGKGETSPYASLLTDLTFKKVFSPDKEKSRKTLVDMLNDLLGPQLKTPIKKINTRNVEQNLSGSAVSRTAIFDLHCEDDHGNLIEIEVQIRKMTNFMKRLAFYASQMVANQGQPGENWKYNLKATFVIAFTAYDVFQDGRVLRRGTTTDLETGKQLFDVYNYTVAELGKVPRLISVDAPELDKWLFLMSHIHELRKIPGFLSVEKFADLISNVTVSKFNKEELEAYNSMINAEYDHNAMVEGIMEDFDNEIQAKVNEACVAVAEKTRKEDKAAHEADTRRHVENALRKGLSPDFVAEINEVSVEYVRQIKAEMK